MDKVVYFNNLFSIYKELLTNREQEIFSYYYEENLSMGEIALNEEVSRSFIGNMVKRTEKKLEELESILKIYEKNQKILEISKEITEENIRIRLLDLIH